MLKPAILSKDVLPSEWRTDDSTKQIVFNPAVTSTPDERIILAYRVVGEDGKRRIGICRLDHCFSPISNSAVPFSDLLSPAAGREIPQQAAEWFADPRLVWWLGRLFIYWNSGIHQPANIQFIQQLDLESLRPVGPCLTLEWEGRQAIEKNWSLFEHQGSLHAFYTLSPTVVLRMTDSNSSALVFSKVASTVWDTVSYTSRFGDLRGGAPPLKIGDKLYIFFHSASRPVLRHRYAVGLLVTSAEPPFQPLSWVPEPILLPNPFGQMPLPNPFRKKSPLNGTVAEVLYPAGVSGRDGVLTLSYGINDQHSAILQLVLPAVEELLMPARLGLTSQAFRSDWRTLQGRAAGAALKLAAAAFRRRT